MKPNSAATSLQLYQKETPAQVITCEIWKTFQAISLQNTSERLLLFPEPNGWNF